MLCITRNELLRTRQMLFTALLRSVTVWYRFVETSCMHPFASRHVEKYRWVSLLVECYHVHEEKEPKRLAACSYAYDSCTLYISKSFEVLLCIPYLRQVHEFHSYFSLARSQAHDHSLTNPDPQTDN
jgi:hypothetical protein